MSLTVGELQVLLSGDPSKLNKELDRLDARAGQTEKTHSAAWGRIGAAAGTAMKAGAALAAAAVVGVGAALRDTAKLGMDYQDQLNVLGAVSGATAAQMDAVSDTAKRLGSDLTLPATSAADAAAVMTELAKAGFSVEDSQTAAKGSLQLAAAAQIEGARAAEIQANAINAFSLKATDAGRVADILANSANASSAEITDVSDALSQASAVAASAGISIEDTAAAIGILANNGIKGSDAGTLLKSALLALQSPSAPAEKAMTALGLSAYDAAGNFVGLSSVFGQLSEAQKKMTPEAYAAATSTLFGSDAARLAGIAGKEGAAGFDLMREAMGKQGAAAEVGAAKSQGLRGAFKGLQSQIETLQIQGFEALAPSMETVVRKATDLVPILGERLFGAMQTALGAAQDMRTQFGPQLSQVADMARTKWDQFTDTVKRIGAEIGPSLPSVAESLVRIAQVGIDVGTGMLPVLNAGIDALGPIAQSAAGMLQMIAGALEAIEPILPAVVAGFLAFKGIDVANRALDALGGRGGVLSGVVQNLDAAAIKAGIFTERLTGSADAGEKVMTGMGKAGTAVGALGAALPVAALAFAAVGIAVDKHRQQVEADTQAILENLQAQDKGGQGAVNARRDLQELRNTIADLEHQMKAAPVAAASAGAGYGLSGAAARGAAREHEDLADQLASAKRQYQEQLDAMTPLERAQQRVSAATNDLTRAQELYGPKSLQAAEASQTLRDRQGDLEQKQRDLDGATKTATQSLLDQANQAIGLANADIGLSNATLGVQNAQANYATVMADAASTTANRQQAENDLASAMINGAGAAGRKAEADNAGKTPAEIHAASTKAQYDALVEFAKQAGGTVPASVQTLMNSLGAATGTAAVTSAAMRDMGLAVTEIPGEKFVRIDAPTAEQQRKVEELGGVVRTLPDGHVYVFANTADADAAVNNFVSKRRTIDILVRAQMPDLNGAVSGSGRMGTAAVGGRVGARARGFSAGGRLDGPGGPTDDRIPALTYSGLPLMLSDDEWVIKARSAALYGDRAMAAVNAGTARIYTPTGSSSGATTSTGSGSVVHKHYHLSTVVREVLTTDQIMRAVRQEEAIYG